MTAKNPSSLRPSRASVQKLLPMIRPILFSLLLLTSAFAGTTPLALRYAQPAVKWTEALPVGNGRLGAMVFGSLATEHLQLNEETLWSGGPRDWNNPGAKAV